jgi:hypothetical protein
MPSSKFWKKAAATRNSYSNGGDNLHNTNFLTGGELRLKKPKKRWMNIHLETQYHICIGGRGEGCVNYKTSCISVYRYPPPTPAPTSFGIYSLNGGDNLMPGENTHIKKVIYRLV